MSATIDPSPIRVCRGFVVLAMLSACLVLVCLSLALGRDHCAMELFGRIDILAVAVLAAIPFSVLNANRTCKSSLPFRIGICGICVMIPLVVVHASRIHASSESIGAMTIAVAHSLVTVSTVTLALIILIAIVKVPTAQSMPAQSVCVQGIFFVLTIALPGVYVDSVFQTLASRLQQTLSDQRVTLSIDIAKVLQQLRPGARIDEMPVSELIQLLDARRQELEAIVDLPQSTPLSAESIANRTTALVQLDRLDQALSTMEPLLSGEQFHPSSFDFYGLCFQRLGDPAQSMIGYELAIRYWTPQADSSQKRRSLASAWKGVGFATRQLGERAKEENAYQELLLVAPTTSNHLLIAKCYQAHQKMSLAIDHVEQAVALDPAAKSELAAILRVASRDHVGCLVGPR